MKVRDLLFKLQGLDRSMDLVCFCNDEGAKRHRDPFLVYAVQRVDVSSMTRSSDGVSQHVVFGPGGEAKQVAVVQITTDF
jgi:hypothetical protein